MGISKVYKEANDDFEILGELENNWEDFRPDADYIGFLVRRRAE